MKLVLVEWIDAHSAEGWQPLDKLIELSKAPMYCRSVGWLLSKNKHTTVLASSISGEKNENMRLMGSGDIAIPNKAIVKMTTLRA